MKRVLFALALLAFGAGSFTTGGAAVKKLSDKPAGPEVAFVQGIQTDLGTRFATAADAEKAGYFRYSNEDDTGAISYANLQWTSADAQHPSQLWYDVNGKLLGADFSVPATDKLTRPHLWGINPLRWQHFGAHVHYVTTDASGKPVYGHATSVAKFTAAGGNAKDPKPETLVKMGLAKDASQVKQVFLFPQVWDLIVWVKPNPNGAFADKNPLVHPSKNAETGSM
ncbi:MAG TPA: hypothetical protein VIG51_03330 [Candidatus Baltobacteraceae bacterium]|jgi:hypothetical protein